MSVFANIAGFWGSMYTKTDTLLTGMRKQALTGSSPADVFIANMVNFWFDAAEGWLNLTPALLADPVPTLFIKLDITVATNVGYVNVPLLPPSVDPMNPPGGAPKLMTTDVIPLTGGGKIKSADVVPSWFDFGSLKVTFNNTNASGLTSGGRYQGLIYLGTGSQPQLVAAILAIVP